MTQHVALHSLAFRLGSSVFRRYLIVAFLLTLVQLSVEFISIRDRVSNDLKATASSFNRSLTKALWEMDRVMLESLVQGMVAAPSVTAVTVRDDQGGVLLESREGAVGHAAPRFVTRTFQTPLRMTTPRGNETLGSVTLFADWFVILAQLKTSSFALVINAVLKATALWLLFRWVFERGLAAPLKALTEMVRELKLVVTHPSAAYSHLVYEHRDELGQLVEATNQLQKKLIDARRENEALLRDLHDGLGAQIVSARLRLLDGAIGPAEVAELLAECMDELYALVDVLNGHSCSLEEALVNLRIRCAKRAPYLTVRLDLNYPFDALPQGDPATVVDIVRILQEAFTNAIKHSGATAVHMSVDISGETLHIVLADAGRGLPTNVVRGRGLNNMQRRARQIGSTVTVDGSGVGTRVAIAIPFDRLIAAPNRLNG